MINCEAGRVFYRLLCNQFNKFNNKGARMSDSDYHMISKLFCNRVFGVKTTIVCQIMATLL